MRNAGPAPYDEAPSGVLAATLEVARRRPFDMLAGALAAACTIMILVNALFLQQGRHPSPFFGAAAPAEPASAAPKRSDLVARVQQALGDRGLYDGPIDGLMGARTAGAIRAFESEQRLPQTGEATETLLGLAMMAPAPRLAEPAPQPAAAPKIAARPAPAPAPAVTGSTTVSAPKLMAVQRALARLGYGPVTIDGKMGDETRNALKSFERDRNMAPTGEPSPAVLRALQAMTGTPFE